ncbi:MAG: hypothetical protein ACKO3B_07155, partial [Bacteroidota bacterium]
MEKVYQPKKASTALLPILAAALLFLASSISMAQNVRLEQAKNGGVGLAPVSPVTWTTGNASEASSHYVEGQSIPYRMVLNNLTAGSHTLVIGWDIRNNSKSAIDYITGFQRIEERVNPLSGLTGTFSAPQLVPIPAPARNTAAKGLYGTQQMPVYSFNRIPGADKNLAIYNATISEALVYSEGDPSATTAETRLTIKFNVPSGGRTVVLSWGGHLASRLDWGGNNTSGDINGSPYHTRFISLDGKGGNQDRSCKVAAVYFIPVCSISGASAVCQGTTSSYSASTDAPNPVYTWSVTGGTIVSGQGTAVISVTWGTGGSGSVNVSIADQSGGLISKTSQCAAPVNISQGTALSATDLSICSKDYNGTSAIINLNER